MIKLLLIYSKQLIAIINNNVLKYNQWSLQSHLLLLHYAYFKSLFLSHWQKGTLAYTLCSFLPLSIHVLNNITFWDCCFMNFQSSLLHVSSWFQEHSAKKKNLFLTSGMVFVGYVHGPFELLPVPHRASLLLPSLQSSQWAIILEWTDPKMGAEGDSLKQARRTLLQMWYGP